jgi:hypothetical protein
MDQIKVLLKYYYLLAASLSRACSFSSTTNGLFLDDFEANDLASGDRTTELESWPQEPRGQGGGLSPPNF